MYKSAIFIIFLLFSSTAALTTYSFTATNSTSEAQLNYVQLGTLASTDVITFLVEFPNPATGANPTQFYISLLDNAKAPLSPQPSGFGSSNMTNINFSGSNTLTWTVSTAGAYYAVIATNSLAASLVPYHLTVTNSNGGLIVKEGDFVRQAFMAVIELASFQSTYSILISGSIIPVLRQVANDTFTTVTHTSNNASEYTYSNLTAGSYVIQALFFGLQTITYQSDSFNCPSYYDPNFPFMSQEVLQACNYTAPPTTTTASATTEDNSTRKRNIALITVFTFVAVAGLVILIVVLAKKSASAGASTAVAAANESSHVNIQNANSSNPNTAQPTTKPS